MANTPPSDNPYRAPGPSFSESRGFVGVDHWTSPQDMSGDFLLDADNMLNQAGILHVRPGLVGLFGGTPPSSSSASPISSSSSQYYDVGGIKYSIPTGPLYRLCEQPLLDAGGNSWILMTAGGKIYKTLQASGYYTELLDVGGASYSINSTTAWATIYQNYAYVVDGSNNYPKRLNLTGGFPAYPMQRSKQSPPVSLTNTLLFAANNAANWSFNGQSTPDGNLLAPYGSINGGQSGSQPSWFGLFTGGTSEPGPWYNMISPGSGFFPVSSVSSPEPQPGALIAVPKLSGTASGTLPGGILYPSRFHCLLPCIKDTQAGSASINVLVTPYNSSMVQLGSAYVTNVVPGNGNIVTIADFIIDMSALGPNVAYINFEVLNAVSVNGGNMYVSTPQLYPITTQVQFNSGANFALAIPSISGGSNATSSSSLSSASSSSSYSSLSGITPTSNTDLGTILDLQGTSFIFTFPASSSSSASPGSSSSGTPEGGIDLSLVNRLVIGVGTGQIASWVGAQFDLYIQNGINGQWILADNGVTISTDLTGLDIDISTLPAADLKHVGALALQFQTNVQWTSPYYGLPLGPISTPGNLSIGLANYIYYWTEKAKINAQNAVESNPSLASQTVVPTFSTAESLVGLCSDMPVNTSAPASVPSAQLWYQCYRGGGAWPDNRLIASVPANASVAYGSDPTNPYYSWNHVTGQLLDNTPDLWLALADLLSFSRDPAPQGAQAIAAWEGRLAWGVGNILYFSWLYNSDNSAGLMTTLVIDLTDPNLAIEGANLPVSSDVTDTIVRLVPYGTPVYAANQFSGGLAVFCKRSVYLIQGTNAGNFTVQQFPYNAGVGLIAMRGVEQIGPNEIIFMGPDRLHMFPPQLDSPSKDIGLRIQPDIYPVPPQALQNQTAFALSWMVYFDSKLLLGCPQPGDSQNSVVWVYDFRTGGWTRITGPNTIINPSSSSNSSSSSLASSSSASGFVPPFPNYGMAMTGAMAIPPAANGGGYDLYYFGISGQLFRSQGMFDQYSPNSSPQAIPFFVNVHAMRPGFFYRFKSRPLYYMWARLERIEVEMMMNGVLTIIAQSYNAGGLNPSPISGKRSVQTYLLSGFGRPFDLNVPAGLIEGQMIQVALAGSVGLNGTNDVAYLRGVRGYISGSTYERA